MNNFTNKKITLIFCLLACTIAISSPVDSSFSYQGEIIDNGVPANGEYDFIIEAENGLGATLGTADSHMNVSVTNGLVNLNVDLGVSYYDGFEDYYLIISIRKSSVGGAYTDIALQQIKAVPLATNLTNGNATTGQVLTFNGSRWNPATPPESPWTVTNSEIYYTSGNVGIGESNPDARLNVKSTQDITANFNGGDNMYVYFEENDIGRGYIGSFQTPNGSILDEDFEIGTTGGSAGNMHIVTGNNEPRITTTAAGKIGINTTNPNADLNINGTNDGDLLRIEQNTLTSFGKTAFYVDKNGGATIGSWDTPPALGLHIEGNTKQEANSNGMMKFMLNVYCASSNASVIKQYNGVNTSVATVTNGAVTGLCRINFPFDISERFFQVSVVNNLAGKNANCQASGSALNCARWITTTGSGNNGNIMVLVY